MKHLAGFYKYIFGLLLTTLLNAGSQDYFPQDFLIRNWNIQSDLKHNAVNALLQSETGYIWIGTPVGLVRFDGIRFTHFNHWNTPVIQNDHVTCLFEDLYGNLWIGTDGGGLLRYKKDTWQHFSTKNGLSNDYIRAICNDWQGNLWVGTDNGLSRYDLNKWDILTTADGLHDNIITSLEMDPAGNLWIGTFRNGITQYDQDIVRVYGYADGLENLSVYSLKSDLSGNIWIGTREGLFFLNRKSDRIQYIAETAHTPITDMLFDDESNLWIATMVDGLRNTSIFDDKIAAEPFAFPDAYIRCLLKDRDGHLWMGTDNNGLVQIKKRIVSMITHADGLPENNVRTLLRDRHGNLWVGFNTSGLCCIKKNAHVDTFTSSGGLTSNRVRTLFEDNGGTIWVGTESGELYRINKNKVELFEKWTAYASDNITAFTQDKDNRLWLGTDGGLFFYENDQLQKEILPTENRSPSIQVLYTSPSGILYSGSGKNLFSYVNAQFVKMITAESEIRCLYEDQHGVLWIGTRRNGLLRWSDGELFSLGVENGLPHNDILSIIEDRAGYLWLSCPRGIIRINMSTLEDFYNHIQTFIVATLFNETDGMINSRCSSGGSSVVSYTPSRDTLFYATVGGIAVVDLHKISHSGSSPRPLIEEIVTDEKILPFDNNRFLETTNDNIRFRFTAFDYSAPEKIYFRYQLTGFDTTYIPIFPGQERIVQFRGIASGEYHFLLQAANRFGEWSKITETVQLKFKRPFYTTFYFYLILVGIVSSTLTSLLYIRRRHRIKRQSEKYKTILIPAHTAVSTLKNLHQFMEVEKIYLDPDLTLSVFARRLHIHANQLSRIINEQYGQNFNDFINKYRIQEAQRKLSDPNKQDKKILEILYETGFYSKSVFNTAFKKITGQTPSAYRRSQVK